MISTQAEVIADDIKALIETLKSSNYLCDKYGNKIESIQAVGSWLLKIIFQNNQKPKIIHCSKLEFFIGGE